MRPEQVKCATHHVNYSKNTRPIPHFFGDRYEGLAPVDADYAERNIGAHVPGEKQQLKTSWKGAHIDGRGELDFSVVSRPKNGGIEQMLFESGIVGRWSNEISLGFIVETCQGAHVLE